MEKKKVKITIEQANKHREDVIDLVKNGAKPCPLCGKNELEISYRQLVCPWTQIRCVPCNLIIGAVAHETVLEKWNKRT